MQRIDTLLNDVAEGRDLDTSEIQQIFELIVSGALPPAKIRKFLLDHSKKGVSVGELVGAAGVLRRRVTPISCDAPNAIDTCGTGGDGISTFNVSTAAAIVAAAAGAVVAKHGNRTHSRRSGSAECIEALGVRTDLSPEKLSTCLKKVGIAFLHAARLHPAMALVATIRKEIGKPTIFNLLGPLTNPAGVRRQIIGVPRTELLEPMARALLELGVVRGAVVHGCGLCDFTITGPSRFMFVENGRVEHKEISPLQLGLSQSDVSELLIDSPQRSAEVIHSVLKGHAGAARNHTLLNAAAALWVAGLVRGFPEGLERAAKAVDGGGAAAKLQDLIRFTSTP